MRAQLGHFATGVRSFREEEEEEEEEDEEDEGEEEESGSTMALPLACAWDTTLDAGGARNSEGMERGNF
eukprot:6318160-Pyramimonas_sp.AAC.1